MTAKGAGLRLLRAFVYLLLFAAAYFLSYLLRFEGMPPVEIRPTFWHSLPVVLAVELAVFWAAGMYRSMWRYTSISDMLQLGRAVGGSALLIAIYGVVLHHGLGQGFPRSIIILNPVLVILLCGGVCSLGRLRVMLDRPKGTHPRTRMLIVGAGEAGSQVIREMLDNPDWGYRPVCFVDDNKSKQGQSLHRCPIFGPAERIPALVRDRDIGQIVIAVPSAGPGQLRRIVALCKEAHAPFRILPGMSDVLNGRVSVSRLRQVEIEDLLGRPPVVLDVEGAAQYLKGRRVLVTGAGGSIGSEICRQIAHLEPEMLLLFSRGENSLYQIHNDLSASFPGLQLVQINGDVINLPKLQRVFERWSPDVVFHAAAHKHVHLCEINPDEAVLANVVGTYNTLAAASAASVQRVVVISTDKACDPAGVLGCTKRLSELLVAQRQWGGMVAAAVRFGNVLGSRGSVIPLFRRQIAAGGPVTVTHPDMVRFFMTIPEAAMLVIHAGGIARGGEIFVLRMGEAVNILTMAREMIRLSGYEPETDIPIDSIGIRPGEKLEETLVGTGETLKDGGSPSIRLICPTEEAQPLTDDDIHTLRWLAINMDSEGIRAKLAALIPSYRDAISAAASPQAAPHRTC